MEGSEMSTRAERPLTEDGEERRRDADTSPPGGGVEATPDRRRFVRQVALGGVAVATGAGLVGALTEASASAQTTTTADVAPTIPAGDVRLINFALGLDLAASQLYTEIAGTGKLSGNALQTARLYVSHHNDHATTFGTLAANQATTTANAKLLSQFGAQITAAADANALYQIAFNLETSLAATDQMLMGTVENWQSAGTVATVEPIETQHAVVWGQLLGLPTSQWMPSFQNTQGSFDLATYLAS
jgi:hypothetical protein